MLFPFFRSVRRPGKSPGFSAIFLAFMICTDSHALAATPQEIISEHEQRLTAEERLQKTKETWMDEKKELLSGLEALEEENRKLEREKTVLGRNRTHLEEGIVAIRRELEEGRRLEEEVDEKVEDIFVRLKGEVEEDLPFLREERTRRLAMLEDLLADPESASAEKLRRVLEALRIEADYGFASEVTQESLEMEGREVVAQVLRLGRIALFYRTGDGSVGIYDMAEKAWKPLEPSWEPRLGRAFEMASRKRAPDLVLLPVGRIVR